MTDILDDSYESDLTDEEHEQLILMSEHAIAPPVPRRGIPGGCADCGDPIGQDKGPPDGWRLEDGRTVCHSCCCADFRQLVNAFLSN